MPDTQKNIALIDYVGSKAGMDFYSLELLKALTQLGYKCSYYSNSTPTSASGVEMKKVFHFNTPQRMISRIIDYCFGYWKATWRATRNKNSYVIHHYYGGDTKELFALGLSRLLGLRILLIVHDVSGLANADSQNISARVFKMASGLIVHNVFSQKALLAILPQNERFKVKVIPHGHYLALSETTLHKSEARSQLGIPAERKVILFFGQIKKAKGLDVLLDAMPEINPDIHLIIAGKPWRTSLEEYQSKIENSVYLKRVTARFTYIDNTQRDAYFRAVDAVVIPYRHIYQSGVLLMAMSYGLPVFASNLEPIREVIIHGENGFLFSEGDYTELASTINKAFENPDALLEIGLNAWVTMLKDYNWQNIAEGYHQIMEELKK